VSDPILIFSEWFEEAKACKDIPDASAMTLATADKSGQPSVRVVLLKGHDERGFVFYTNFESRKASELKNNPRAALCFHWAPIMKQVRVEGIVEQVSDAEANAYFKSRPRESQLGAWASKQSAPLADMAILQAAISEVEARYSGMDVPRPPFWSGYRVMPGQIEFWKQGDHRIHERSLFVKSAGGWLESGLYP